MRGATDAALTASWDAARRSFASGAGKNVIKGAAEQTDDGIELFIPNCRIAEEIAFDDQRRLVVTLGQHSGKGGSAPTRRQRR